MKTEWQVKSLSEVANVIDSLHRTPTYSTEGVPMIRVKDITGGAINLASTKRVSLEVFRDFSAKRVPQPGDILFSRVGSYGNFGYLLEATECCLGQNTALLVPNCDWRFLYYSLISDNVTEQVNQLVVGAVQKTISLKSMKMLQLGVPLPAEQRRIAEVLGALDDKIELNRKMNQTLEAMAQALFKSWFVDFDPVIDNTLRAGTPIPDDLQAKATRRRAVMARDSYEIPPYANLFPDSFEDSELGSIPAGWQVVKFSDVSESLNKKRAPVSKLERQKRQGRFPYYGASGIVDHVDSYIFEGEHLLISEDGENLRTRKTPIAFIATGRFWVNNHAHILLGRSGVSIEHLQIFFAQLDVDPYLSGAVQPKLSQRNLQRIPFLCGPVEVLNQFNEVVVGMFDSIRGNDAENEFLIALRDTLLPKLISGEVRVPASAVPGVAE